MERRTKGRASYMVSQAVAQQLVLADKFQTFDSTRIWTQVPGGETDHLSDQFSWDSESTKGTTVMSSEGASRPSSVTGSQSRRSRSRRGSKGGSFRGTPSHPEPGSVHSGGGGGGAKVPLRYLGEGAATPQAAARVDRGEQDDAAADTDGKLVVLVLDHHGEDGATQRLDEDTQVLHDFWGNGLADEKVDRELVVKIAEALGCDPSRLNIEWSRIMGGEYGAADSDGLDNVDNDAVSIEEEEDENADVGLEGVHTIRQE